VEWLDFKGPHGIVRKRRFPLPRSLTNFKHDFSELKCTEARDWISRKLAKTGNRKHRPSESKTRTPSWQAPANPLPHRTTSPVDQSPGREVLVVPIQNLDPRTPVQECPQWRCHQKTRSAAVNRKPPEPDQGTRSHQNRGAARRRTVQSSGPRFSRDYRCREDVRPTGGRGRRRSGQRGFRVGEQETRGATRIVERGRGEAGGGGLVHFSFVTLYFSLVFHLSFFCHTTSGGQPAEASA